MLFTVFMAKALMIQGTGSGAGKSLVAAAFCRIFRNMGLKVAPFKAQNMALNSHITAEGGEIGRAQALQADAAGIEPSVDMNPILLKASGEAGSQVILQGKVHSTMKASEYYSFRKEAWEAVRKSYARLSRRYDMIVIEGAGSPAEINLADVDIVNMSVAKHAKAPVLLIGDIDRGGVFASLYGTVKLLGRNRRHIKAFVINKFRGDIGILRPGLDMIEDKTGIPVIGVLPYMHDIGLPEEDGLALYRGGVTPPLGAYRDTPLPKAIKIVIVRLRYISNFTDFDPFYHEPDVEILYSTNASDIENADLVIIPGTKNTVKDLMLLKEKALDASIRNSFIRGNMIIGICGGYQMLGRKIFDPQGVESNQRETEGIGLLNIETIFGRGKRTCRVDASVIRDRFPFAVTDNGHESRLNGYEIHMGQSTGDIGLFSVKNLSVDSKLKTQNSKLTMDGSRNGNCWGTYIHGIFDNDLFRREIINAVRVRKGLLPLGARCSYSEIKEGAINRLADAVRENIDMDFIREMLSL